MDQCENCEQPIGKLEQAYLVKNHVVCRACWTRLAPEAEEEERRSQCLNKINDLGKNLGLTREEDRYAFDRASELVEVALRMPWMIEVMTKRVSTKVGMAVFAVLLIRMEDLLAKHGTDPDVPKSLPSRGTRAEKR